MTLRKILVLCVIVGLIFGGMISIAKVPASSYDNSDNRFYYDQKFAVILVGYYGDEQHYDWFTRDAQRQYTILTEKYGFSDNNIYVLLTLKEEWINNLNIDPDIIDYNASEENIKIVFNNFKEIMTENDLLYMLVIDHGGDDHYLPLLRIGIDVWQGKFAHDTYFGLEKTGEHISDGLDIKYKYNFGNYENKSAIDNRIYDHELSDYTKDINARRIIFVLQPCFSGGFVNDLSKKNHVIFTASRERQPAFAGFIGYFSHGLNGSADDSNNDGEISLGEIYEYTAGEVYTWIKNNPEGNMGRLQHPLIDDDGDKVGHRYNGLFGYDLNDPHKDGYVAAQIFDLNYELL